MLTFAYWSSDMISELWENWEFLSAVIELVLGDSKYTDFLSIPPSHVAPAMGTIYFQA